MVEQIHSNPKIPPKAVKVQFESELNIDISKMKAYRALKLAHKSILGDYEAQYSELRDYLEELMRCHPDSTVKVETEPCDPDLPTRVFKRVYICLGPLRKGFKAIGRELLGLDGAFMKEPATGHILTSVGIDSNNDIYPVAYAIVEQENFNSWSWFLDCLGDDLGLNRNSNFTFMSDRQKGLSIPLLCGSPPLFWSFVGWSVAWTAYSVNLPLLRWKRFPLIAAFVMLISRAWVVPIGYYMHMKSSIHGGSILLSRPIQFAVGMLSAFSVSTIFFKDIPDLKGDQIHGIKSLASRLGETRMFWSCIWILEIAYVAACFVGATSSITWSKYATIISHLVMASILWTRAKSVDLKSMEAIQSMYMFLWQLFYVEYGLITLVR